MNCHSKRSSASDVQLFAFAEQQLPCKAADITTITTSDKVEFDVIEFYEFMRGDMHPAGLFLLATGKNLTKESVWKSFRKSKKMYFFVAKIKADE